MVITKQVEYSVDYEQREFSIEFPTLVCCLAGGHSRTNQHIAQQQWQASRHLARSLKRKGQHICRTVALKMATIQVSDSPGVHKVKTHLDPCDPREGVDEHLHSKLSPAVRIHQDLTF
jgi:hypothetical protein